MTTEMSQAANVKQAVPFFMVASIDESVRYYVDGLGFEMTHKWIDEGRLQWCWLQCGGAALMLQEIREDSRERFPAGKLGLGVSICFICEDALALYRDFSSRGIEAA